MTQPYSVRLNWSAFDFNNKDLDFIDRQQLPPAIPAVHSIVRQLRHFGMERAANPAMATDYSFTLLSHNHVTEPRYVEEMKVTPSINFNPGLHIKLEWRQTGNDSRPNESVAIKAEQALRLFDNAMPYVRENHPEWLSAYHTLRNIIATASGNAATCSVIENELSFIFHGDNWYALHLKFGHFSSSWLADAIA